ncbi:MAG: DUF4105 domain-containing protein [Tannerellaceae bacterium]|nr:DUF4105 domain-containing protein [Tannerellaceae bacterium]
MKKSIFFLFLLLTSGSLKAQLTLSENTEISILTSSPSNDEVFTLYGHTALRIQDPDNNINYVFNYGIFDFSKPNFIYRFAKGETDYILAGIPFDRYLVEYQLRGSQVTEQVLNLTQREKQEIWDFMMWNAQPENRVYRYNFFFDNCSTRPLEVIEGVIRGTVEYPEPENQQTFRDMINYSTRNHPWQAFGCDLALGSPTDRIATPKEEMFLPEYLMHAFDKAQIRLGEGQTRPLVLRTNILTEENPEINNPGKTLFTPLVCNWLLFLVVTNITLFEWKRKKQFRWLDCLLFDIAGIAGCILVFLASISEHPCTSPNWNLLWLHPLHLAGAVLFAVKKFGKAAYYYHFINFATLTLVLLGWHFIPQHMNTAFIPLIGILWIRSGWGVLRYKSGKE